MYESESSFIGGDTTGGLQDRLTSEILDMVDTTLRSRTLLGAVCIHMCMHVCVCACVCTCVHVHPQNRK